MIYFLLRTLYFHIFIHVLTGNSCLRAMIEKQTQIKQIFACFLHKYVMGTRLL